MLNFPSFFNAQVGGYEIEQSLRFDGSGTGFPPTGGWLGQDNPSSGGSTTQWTCSFWAKRGNSGSVKMLMSSIYQPNNNEAFGIQFTANDTLKWGLYSATTFETAQVFRDYSAWYHIVLVWDSANATAAHRCRLYVNGEEVTTWTTRNDPALNAGNPWCQNGPVPSGSQNLIGYQRAIGALAWYQSLPYNGYMAEFHCVQGQALDADDFGESNDDGVWVPKKYAGTYSGNAFYLKFDAADVDGDSSGLGNDWTASNFTTSGTGTDVMSDTPTTNYPTWNALERGDDPAASMGVDLSEGNLVAAMNRDVADGAWVANFTVPSSGKWYWEVEQLTAGSPNPFITTGIIAYPWTWNSSDHVKYDSRGRIGKDWNGVTYQSVSAWGAGYGSASDVCGVAVDADNNTVQFYKNGTSQGTTESYSGSTYTYVPHCTTAANTAQNVRYNFGQRAFAYTPPTGFKPLNTANLPAPTVKDGSKNFNTVLYSGVSGDNAVTGVGFQPDLVWIKSRSTTGADHELTDVVRGVTKALHTNTQGTEDTFAEGLQSFDTDGFTVGDDHGNYNRVGRTYVAWNWDAGGNGSSNTAGSITSTVSANPSAGFSIVTWNGSAANGTVGHNLGVAPDLIIFKRRNATTSWPVYHSAISPSNVVYLNEGAAQASSGNSFGSSATAPTSTVFSVGDKGDTNYGDMLAYCFAEVEGYSKFGSYVGNGVNDGPFVFLGFRPALILTKRTNSTSNWVIQDSTRQTYNPSDAWLRPNTPDDEGTTSPDLDLDFLSNGFKVRNNGTDNNISGSTYIFMALAENPFGGEGVSPATAR